MTDRHSYPVDPLIRIVIEKFATILVCSFVIFLGNHEQELWNQVLEEINVSYLIYYLAWGVVFYSVYRMSIVLVMIAKHDKSADAV